MPRRCGYSARAKNVIVDFVAVGGEPELAFSALG
jgi:hypothetical protein